MKFHTLKCEARYFEALERGDKTCELRKNDRDFQTGDIILLEYVWPTDLEGPTCDYKPILFRITHVLTDAEQYGLAKGHAILSLKPYRPKVSKAERINQNDT